MKRFVLTLLMLSPSISNAQQIKADYIDWKKDESILFADSAPRFYISNVVKEENVVEGDLQVTTCVEYDGGECVPSNAFYSVITSENI